MKAKITLCTSNPILLSYIFRSESEILDCVEIREENEINVSSQEDKFFQGLDMDQLFSGPKESIITNSKLTTFLEQNPKNYYTHILSYYKSKISFSLDFSTVQSMRAQLKMNQYYCDCLQREIEDLLFACFYLTDDHDIYVGSSWILMRKGYPYLGLTGFQHSICHELSNDKIDNFKDTEKKILPYCVRYAKARNLIKIVLCGGGHHQFEKYGFEPRQLETNSRISDFFSPICHITSCYVYDIP